MSTRRNSTVLLGTAATVGLLFLYPTSTNHSRRSSHTAAPAGIVTPATGRTPTSGTATGKATAPAVPATLTVNGTAVDTRYGPVQVQIRWRAGRILAATAVVYPQDSGRDKEINSYAVPVLQSETLKAQSASIDMVSGATYTSHGYEQSLQSAIDSARTHA